MPQDLQQLADRVEINDLLLRYAQALETKDWELLSTCFTDDARVDYSASGGVHGTREQAIEFLSQTMPLFSATFFVITNAQIAIDSDGASGRTHFETTMLLGEKGSASYLVAAGYYVDKFRRTGAGWRISERVEEPVYIDTFTPARGPTG
jgi:3-phenylpropionate/cinnamic acid dioxygenase small subunit